MFAATESWPQQQEEFPTAGSATKGLSPLARAALHDPRDTTTPSGRLKHGTRPDATPEAKRISRGRKTGTQDSTWGIVIPALELVLDEKSPAQRTQKILLKLWKRSPEKTRQKISAIVSRLSKILSGEENSVRMCKRLRRILEKEKALLILSGFLHQLDAKMLQKIGLSQVAEFMNSEEKPLGLLQCLLRCVIEFEKVQDRKPALILLDLIQNGDYTTENQMILSCWVLDLLDADPSLSVDGQTARNTIQTLFTGGKKN